MNIYAINELVNQIDAVAINTSSKLNTNLSKKLQKKAKIALHLNIILNNALEFIYTILIVASILGIYFASGLHEWWTQLVGYIN